jgi:hypothetical protein
MASVWQRLGASGQAFAAVRRTPSLRRALLAFGFAWTAEWAFTVTLGVVAFRNGGATAVGIVAFVRMVPAALLAPTAIAASHRFRRDHMLVYSSLSRAGAIAAASLMLAVTAPVAAVYVFALLATAAFVVFRPAHSALLPALCTTPLELTSANVVRGLLDSIGVLVGSLSAAVLIAVSGPIAALAFAAALLLVAGALLFRLSYEAVHQRSSLDLRRVVTDTTAGFRALSLHRDAGPKVQ